MKTFLTHWKTTVNGLLAFLITTLTTIGGFLGTQNLVSDPHPSIHSIGTMTWVTIGINLALALCRAWVGLLQKDAGSELAAVPGSATPQLVPSHETPNDPAAKPVDASRTA